MPVLKLLSTPMSNYEQGSVEELLSDGLGDELVGFVVDVASRFIKQHHWPILSLYSSRSKRPHPSSALGGPEPCKSIGVALSCGQIIIQERCHSTMIEDRPWEKFAPCSLTSDSRF